MTICQRCKRPIKWLVDWHGKPVACEPEGVMGYTQRGRQILVYPKHECPSTEDGGGGPERAA